MRILAVVTLQAKPRTCCGAFTLFQMYRRGKSRNLGVTLAGRIYGDGSVIGTIQFRGAGLARTVSLPARTLRVRGEAVCASLQGMPFEPCFHVETMAVVPAHTMR